MKSSTILVVDDEPVQVDALARTLRKSGYDVHTANRGADALQIVESRQIDLVLSDLRIDRKSVV